MYVVFDIETRPLPRDRLEKIADAVKWKPSARTDTRETFIEKAALSAATSTVLAIGTWRSDDNQIRIVAGDDEPNMLVKFWQIYRLVCKSDGRLIGFNSQAFDIPFLVRRSLLNKISVPGDLFTSGGYLNYRLVDLRNNWTLPRLYGNQEKSSLAYLAEVFQLPATKMEGVTGDQFWQLWESNWEQAIEYLRLDIVTTVELGKAMGVIR